MFWKRVRPAPRRRANDPAGGAIERSPVPEGPPPRLVDLAGDWLALVIALRECPEVPDPGRLRKRAHELRKDLERLARAAQFSEEDIRAAIFSLAAFTDEVVRRTRGRAREEWIARPLQLEWFETNSAGGEFYDQLDEQRKNRDRRKESLEVSTCCLALGFEGKLGMAPEKRSALLDDLLVDIGAVRGAGEMPLAPRAVGKDRPTATGVPELPRWISAVAFGLAVLLVWLTVTQSSRIAFKDVAARLERSAQH